jgi:hypothetical protein
MAESFSTTAEYVESKGIVKHDTSTTTPRISPEAPTDNTPEAKKLRFHIKDLHQTSMGLLLLRQHFS